MKITSWFYRIFPIAMIICLSACGNEDTEGSSGPSTPSNNEIEPGWGAGKTDIWDGSSDISWYDPTLNLFHLYSAAQLAGFAELVNAGTNFRNKTVTLEVNVKMNERISFDEDHNVINPGSLHVWTPIGNGYPNIFNGTFDGKKHIISGMYINDKQIYAVGLFSQVGKGNENKTGSSIVKNIGIVNSFIEGNEYAGSVVGYLSDNYSPVWNSLVSDCYSDCVVKGKTAGGIVGIATNYSGGCKIEGCFNKGYIYGKESAGGIVGNGSTIEKSYNKGAVNGKTYSGGIAGTSRRVTDCYNLGTITGNKYGAGISGCASHQNDEPAILFCYNKGLIKGTNIKGTNILCGIASIYYGNIVSCYSYNDFEVVLPTSYPVQICGIAGIGSEGFGMPSYCVYNSYSIVNCNTYNYKEVEGHAIKLTGTYANCYSKYHANAQWNNNGWCAATFKDNSGVLSLWSWGDPGFGQGIPNGCETLIEALNAYYPGRWKIDANENGGYPVLAR